MRKSPYGRLIDYAHVQSSIRCQLSDRPHQVTQILGDLSGDDPQATARLLPLVYEELRGLASQKLVDEPSDHTLQATALVHEAYLRLIGNGHEHWDNRGHFFAAAAEAMRRILVDRARKYASLKHGGGKRRVELDPDCMATVADVESSDGLLALDKVLCVLEKQDPARSAVVKLRYFAGLNIEQTAELLGISTATANRHWAFARAWLCRAIMQENQKK